MINSTVDLWKKGRPAIYFSSLLILFQGVIIIQGVIGKMAVLHSTRGILANAKIRQAWRRKLPLIFVSLSRKNRKLRDSQADLESHFCNNRQSRSQ